MPRSNLAPIREVGCLPRMLRPRQWMGSPVSIFDRADTPSKSRNPLSYVDRLQLRLAALLLCSLEAIGSQRCDSPSLKHSSVLCLSSRMCEFVRVEDRSNH